MKPLDQFSDKDLLARFQSLAKNLFFSNGQLFVPDNITQIFNEAYDEVRRRGPIPPLEVETLISASDPTPVFHDKFVVRYSKRKRLEDLTSGIVCFGPSKIYSGLSNFAQRDNELQRSWHLQNTTLMIGGTAYPASNIVLNQPIKEKDGDFIHYHSLFLSVEESPKLQRAFEAEGYVLIHDYKVFYDTIVEALRAKLGNGCWGSDMVSYYDDQLPQNGKSIRDLVFSKSIAYRYQREVRIAVFHVQPPEDWLEIKVTWPAGLISPIKSF